jgi:hypothetical protein
MKKNAILFTLVISFLLISSSVGALSSSVNISSYGTISYPSSGKATVIISANAGGTTTPAPGTYEYDLNTIVTITAAPNVDFNFKNWLIGGSTTNASNPISFNVTAVRTYSYQAVFESTSPPVYTVPIPNTTKYQNWALTMRVSTDFMSYVSGTSFNFTGFFDHQYSLFLAELDAVPWSNLQTYTPNEPTWSPPSYQAGAPINGGSLKDVALAGAGIVVSSGTADDINNAINSLSSSQWLVYVEEGVYDGEVVISRPYTVLAGAGWNTVVRKTANYYQAIRVIGSANNVIIRDLTVDGNYPFGQADMPSRGMTIVANCEGGRMMIENTFSFSEWAFGPNLHNGPEGYMINNAASGCGANTFEITYSTQQAAIGNYGREWVDVGISTWGSNNVIVAQNMLEDPVAPHGGAYTRINAAIMVEGFGGDTSYNILIRDNHASDLQGQSDRGAGVQMSPGAHHVVVCRGTYNNNNDVGVSPDSSEQGYILFYDVHPTGNRYADVITTCPGGNLWVLP